MDLSDIVQQLGAKRHGDHYRSRCPAHDDKHPSLWFMESNGKIYFECKAGCDYRDIREAIGIHGKIKFEPTPVIRDPLQEGIRRKRIKNGWEAASPLSSVLENPVTQYLIHTRRLFERGDAIPDCLRFDNACRYYDHDRQLIGQFPAMVARLDSPEGELITLHKTYLTEEGKKTHLKPGKKLATSPYSGATDGGAIRLFQPKDGCLGIAEGIETAIAAHRLFGVSTWATWSASGTTKFQPPEDLDILYIFADHDEPGIKAANQLSQRLSKERVQLNVQVAIPPTPGMDFDDLLQMELGANG